MERQDGDGLATAKRGASDAKHTRLAGEIIVVVVVSYDDDDNNDDDDDCT